MATMEIDAKTLAKIDELRKRAISDELLAKLRESNAAAIEEAEAVQEKLAAAAATATSRR